MTTPADPSPSPRRRWSRRRIALVVVVVLVVGIRAALPYVIRSVLEDQGTALLEGSLTVGNVDLSLLRGLVTLEDVALHADGAGPDDRALVAFRRFWVNVAWTPLVRKTVEVQDVGLRGLSAHVDRLADGDLVLPSVRESESAEEPPPAVEDEATVAEDDSSEPWGVMIDRLTFEDGTLELYDHVTDPPETRRLSLPALGFTNFRLQPNADAKAGRGRVRLELSDGVVDLRTRVRAVESGFDLALAIEVTDLPLDRVHVHLPELGWNASRGRLGGLVTARVSPSTPLVASGTVELEDLGIEVPGEDGPALEWRSLAVDVEKIDLAARHASIERVALDGGRVLVRPTAPTPLPFLPADRSGSAAAAPPPAASGPAAATPDAPPAEAAAGDRLPEEATGPAAAAPHDDEALEEEEEGEGEDGQESGVVEAEGEDEAAEGDEPRVVIGDDAPADGGDDTTASGAEDAPGDGAAPAGEAAPAPAKDAAPADDAGPWGWSVGRLEVTDTVATVFLEPPPLDVEVRKLEVVTLSSDPGAEATVHAEVGIADGALAIDGPIVLDPLGGTVAIEATDLDVGRLVAASGAVPTPLVARLDADLDVTARDDPLVVRGRVDLRDVETKVDDGDEFLVAWKALAIALERVAVPGLLPFGNEGGIGDVDVELATVSLEAPRVVTTLTSDGLVLPAAPPPEPASTAAEAPPEPAPPAAEAAEGGGLLLRIDQLTVRDGDVRFTDTTVNPAYRGRLARLAVDARGVQVPENRVDRITVSTRVGGKAPVEVKSVREGDAVIVTSTLRDVPLSQFNPYATAYGYRIAGGTLSLDSETKLRGAAYDSDNRFHLDRFAVTGVEGDALFKKTFGVPLTVALALLRDMNGRISLGVPVAGDERGTGVAIGPIVREALARAIVGALASPLKLLGGLRLGKGKIQAFEPEPIAFEPGTTDVAPGSKAQAKQLAGALEQLPAVRIQLAGRAGANDARALAEQAVLADLEAESGVVGGVRNLFSGGTRGDVRAALRERAGGKAGPLEGDAARQLDEWVAEHPIDQARLLELATARVAALRTLLVEGGGRPEQIVVGEPKARRKSGVAEVDVDVAEEVLADDDAA